mmetsp:Transcript_30567/g.95012  ORF Transcript_30567/g.95012 Transcript_30567/m.95012 type:complete len:225 (+) Transcript_30567:82-756(+)
MQACKQACMHASGLGSLAPRTQPLRAVGLLRLAGPLHAGGALEREIAARDKHEDRQRDKEQGGRDGKGDVVRQVVQFEHVKELIGQRRPAHLARELHKCKEAQGRAVELGAERADHAGAKHRIHHRVEGPDARDGEELPARFRNREEAPHHDGAGPRHHEDRLGLDATGHEGHDDHQAHRVCGEEDGLQCPDGPVGPEELALAVQRPEGHARRDCQLGEHHSAR